MGNSATTGQQRQDIHRQKHKRSRTTAGSNSLQTPTRAPIPHDSYLTPSQPSSRPVSPAVSTEVSHQLSASAAKHDLQRLQSLSLQVADEEIEEVQDEDDDDAKEQETHTETETAPATFVSINLALIVIVAVNSAATADRWLWSVCCCVSA